MKNINEFINEAVRRSSGKQLIDLDKFDTILVQVYPVQLVEIALLDIKLQKTMHYLFRAIHQIVHRMYIYYYFHRI